MGRTPEQNARYAAAKRADRAANPEKYRARDQARQGPERHERDFRRAQQEFLEARGKLPTLLYHVSAKYGLVESDIESVTQAFKTLEQST